MDISKSIVTKSGTDWQHRILEWLATRKEFPLRLRLISLLRELWNLDLVMSKTPSGLKLLLDVTDWVQSQIFLFGNHEPKSVALMKSLAVEASVIFDIGAHIGQYALECAYADPAIKKSIFAFEVNPKTFTYLLNNIQLNRFENVIPILGAVTSMPGIININIPAYWNMGNTQINLAAEGSGLNNYQAASLNLISLIEKYSIQQIDLVKIDLEGHEASVIEDLFLKNIHPKNIIFEYIPEVFETAKSLLALLDSNGYLIKDIDGKNYIGQQDIPEQNLWAQKK